MSVIKEDQKERNILTFKNGFFFDRFEINGNRVPNENGERR